MMSNEYKWDRKADTKDYQIMVDSVAYYGYFEHHTYGDEKGGGLWFDGKELIDFDGMTFLPSQVREQLRSWGFTVDPSFE